MTTIAPNTASAALKKLFDAQAAQAIALSGDEAGIKALYMFRYGRYYVFRIREDTNTFVTVNYETR